MQEKAEEAMHPTQIVAGYVDVESEDSGMQYNVVKLPATPAEGLQQDDESIKVKQLGIPAEDGNSATAVRFINNPYGTPLATITESKSCATLSTSSAGAPGMPCMAAAVPKRISQSVDEAALREFRAIFTSSRADSHLSSDPANEALGNAQYTRPASPYYPAFARCMTPLGQRRWPGDLDSSPTHRPSGRRGPGDILRSVRDYFRITTPSRHGQTAFSRDAIRLSRPHWRPSVNSYAYCGEHPFQRGPIVQPVVIRSSGASQKESSGDAETHLQPFGSIDAAIAEDGQ